MWDALGDIARAQGIKVQELVRRIDRSRAWDEGLTAVIRVYIVEFYRARVTLHHIAPCDA
jgi:predicted DNA-binding ribbon-helix-helix protein